MRLLKQAFAVMGAIGPVLCPSFASFSSKALIASARCRTNLERLSCLHDAPPPSSHPVPCTETTVSANVIYPQSWVTSWRVGGFGGLSAWYRWSSSNEANPGVNAG